MPFALNYLIIFVMGFLSRVYIVYSDYGCYVSSRFLPVISLAVLFFMWVYLFLYSLSTYVRRLHDMGRSGFWALLGYTGVIVDILRRVTAETTSLGQLIHSEAALGIGLVLTVLFIFTLLSQEGTEGVNAYGHEPF